MSRRVIVTGGSRGIGAACVRAFAESGDRVVFICRGESAASASVAAGTGAVPVYADLSDGDQARRACLEAAEKLGGGIDVLVNCAGIAHIGLFTDMTDGEWREMIDTDLSAAFRITQEAVRIMLREHKGNGRIINIGSVWGGRGASCEVAYSAAKAGMRGFSQALARELGPSGITVNCVEPGVIDTDMNSGLTEETRKELIDSTPLCRTGTPEDVAAAVTFLASDAAGFITAAIIPVDGGFPS
ncbi:MAG: 3-oxoacyl-ACP reductase FabG [Clostridia bacterium]|nr:3-oxoacyl-ACP reductase FabG [Clostridia bacterium]